MGGFRAHALRWPAAVAVVVALAGGLGLLAAHWTRSPYERLADWLREQPGVESVDHVNGAGSSQGSESPQIARPTAEVTTSAPLTAASLRSFMNAFQRFGAREAKVKHFTVQLSHGGDSVLASAQQPGNERVAAVFDAMRELPDIEAVSIELAPRSPSRAASGELPVLPSLGSTGPRMVAVLAPSADLPAAASRLAADVGVAPSAGGSSPWRGAGLTVQAAGLRHVVTVLGATGPPPRAAAAFAAAVRAEGRRPVELLVTTTRSATSTTLRLSPDSPSLPSTHRLVNAIGYGMPAHEEEVVPRPVADHAPDFDVDAWAARALPPVRDVPGVRRAALAFEGDPAWQRSVLDVRVGTATDLAELAAAVPDAVDVVRVHTAPTPLDPDRDDALPEDPEQGCPAGPAGVVNTAYSGPAAQFAGAARQLALLAATGRPTCLHWTLSARAAPMAAPTLAIRVPSLRQGDWQPVLDAILAQRRSDDGNRPRIGLLVPGTPEPWTAMLLLDPVQDQPSPSSAVAASPTEMRAAMAALAPLVRYWDSRLGRR